MANSRPLQNRDFLRTKMACWDLVFRIITLKVGWLVGMRMKEARQQDIAITLKALNSTDHLVGENLQEVKQVFRIRVVTVFLKSAVSICKKSVTLGIP